MSECMPENEHEDGMGMHKRLLFASNSWNSKSIPQRGFTSILEVAHPKTAG